jgi:GWxTD domain-containing protein
VKKTLTALAGLIIAASALAQLSKYKDWDKSPEAYFLTPPERADWKKVASDADAENFIAIYWAKRGGEPFRQEISRRIAAADQQFKMPRYKRGADSVRGRLLITLGAPTRVSQSRAQEGVSGEGDAVGLDTRLRSDTGVTYVWTYTKDKFPATGLPDLRAQITVDPQRGSEALGNSTEVEHTIATVAEKSIVNPNATAAPSAAGAPAGAPPAAPPAAGAAAPPSSAPAGAPAAPARAPAVLPLPAAAKSALQAATEKGSGDAGFYSGTFRSGSGDPFLALQFYLPANKPAFSAATPLKFGAVVVDESGKEAASRWENANVSEVAEGARKDRVVDQSIALPPGKYKGTFGLFAAEDQPPVASAHLDFELSPKSPDFGVSPLILSNGLVPLTKRPGSTDPFVFGSEKPIKVEPKGDHLFTKQDSLWYFYSVDNPGLPAAAPAAATPAAPAAPAAGGAAAAPSPTVDAPKPRIMTKINVQKDGVDAFAPFTGPAELQPIAASSYATGSEIPLASFEPGHYTFIIIVRDLNAAKGSEPNKGIERREEFVVLMPDGSLPPKKAAATAPTPKPKKP